MAQGLRSDKAHQTRDGRRAPRAPHTPVSPRRSSSLTAAFLPSIFHRPRRNRRRALPSEGASGATAGGRAAPRALCWAPGTAASRRASSPAAAAAAVRTLAEAPEAVRPPAPQAPREGRRVGCGERRGAGQAPGGGERAGEREGVTSRGWEGVGGEAEGAVPQGRAGAVPWASCCSVPRASQPPRLQSECGAAPVALSSSPTVFHLRKVRGAFRGQGPPQGSARRRSAGQRASRDMRPARVRGGRGAPRETLQIGVGVCLPLRGLGGQLAAAGLRRPPRPPPRVRSAPLRRVSPGRALTAPGSPVSGPSHTERARKGGARLTAFSVESAEVSCCFPLPSVVCGEGGA